MGACQQTHVLTPNTRPIMAREGHTLCLVYLGQGLSVGVVEIGHELFLIFLVYRFLRFLALVPRKSGLVFINA